MNNLMLHILTHALIMRALTTKFLGVHLPSRNITFKMKAQIFFIFALHLIVIIDAQDQCPDPKDESTSCQELEFLLLENNGQNLPYGLQCNDYAKYLSPALAGLKLGLNFTTMIDFAFELLKVTELYENKNVSKIISHLKSNFQSFFFDNF